MKYLQSTMDLPLVVSADSSGQPKWHIDASYAVPMDMKSHTGGSMSLGKGSVYSMSVKQKLVTRSSTERG
jgi:predicted metalloprotease